MPCRDDGCWTDASLAAEKRALETKKEADLLARFVCGIFRAAETHNQLEDLLKVYPWQDASVSKIDMETWWKRHKIEDDDRIAREKETMRNFRLKTEALSKLSEEEKEALGLR